MAEAMGEAAGVFEGEEEDATLEGDGVAQTSDSRRSGGSDRFSTFNIVVIALLALTAAVLTWRSFVLEGTASDLDHQAATQALAASSVAALADQEVTSEQSEYQRYLASLQTVHSLARTTQPGPPSVVVEKALAAELAAGDAIRVGLPPGGGSDTVASFDPVRRRVELAHANPYVAAAADQAAVSARADHDHRAGRRMLWYVVLLAGLAVVATAGQLMSPRARAAASAACGVGLVTVTTVALVAAR